MQERAEAGDDVVRDAGAGAREEDHAEEQDDYEADGGGGWRTVELRPSRGRVRRGTTHAGPPSGWLPYPIQSGWAGRKLLCAGGEDGTEAHLPNPAPLLGRRAGRGVWAGATLPAVPGGGGVRTQHTWLKMIPTSR